MNGPGPLWRRARATNPLMVDSALALALFAITLVDLATHTDCPCVSAADVRWGVFFMATQTLPLALRRRYPFTVMNVVGFSALVYDVLALPPDPSTAVFGAILALYSVSTYARRDLAIVAGVITLVAVGARNIPGISGQSDFGDAVQAFFLYGGAWIVGDNVRQRRRQAQLLEERAERAEREREERARIAAFEERNRIAREIHDVVSHSVSVVAVQAGAARRVIETRPEQAEEALRAIEEVSRGALSELRQQLQVLREPADAGTLAPQPGLARLPELLEQVRQAGLGVEMTEQGTRRDLPPSLDLSVYRVVQEALTNTLKHAPGNRATVALRFRADDIEIEVADEGQRSGGARLPDGQGAGQGLVGMRERVAMHGGTLEAGPTPEGFAVRARLPLARDGDAR